ncbi:CLUMA_CG019247, isoform A [Clunio marinus]|uniref:CLUMA_CG019247, isoform A n=1 Tax=Clunio marinus TaxID=568069 RepID=A0A1J1J1Q7_9DIPT|nr:CLUMA_CG019247, isoform A [Clunio marinus]
MIINAMLSYDFRLISLMIENKIIERIVSIIIWCLRDSQSCCLVREKNHKRNPFWNSRFNPPFNYDKLKGET